MTDSSAAPGEEIQTRSHLPLWVRPATLEDEAAVAEFFERVSPQDRRFRFFSAQVGQAQIDPLVDPAAGSESFLAFNAISGALAATGMLACDEAGEVAEVAVSVAAEYRGKGVGWALLDLLAREARQRGVREVIAIEDRANASAIELEREKGFVARDYPDDPTLVILSKRFDG